MTFYFSIFYEGRIRINKIVVFPILFFWAGVIFRYTPVVNNTMQRLGDDLNNIDKDTIHGYFLYEVDVPQKCFTRFDQIEQGKNMIFYDSLLLKKDIKALYLNGVFTFNYQPLMQKSLKDYSFGSIQNKTAINEFVKRMDYLTNIQDTAYANGLYHDGKNILTYKKIYAELVVGNLGNQEQLIPNTMNYFCCYSNSIESLNTFFIIDILNFKIY